MMNWAAAAALTASFPLFLRSAEVPRVFETVLPALTYSPGCSSTVSLRNLSGRDVSVDVEAHRSDGALVAVDEGSGGGLELAPGQSTHFKLDLADDPGDAWVLVRERVPAAELSAAVAVSGVTECITGNELSTAVREVAFPRVNPKFSGQADAHAGKVLLLVNASEQPASAWVCEAAVGYYTLPGTAERPVHTRPLCAAEYETQIGPFGTRRFPLGENPAGGFLLESRGRRIVLQMLKPARTHVRLYAVDSAITYGGEVPPTPPANR